MNGNNQESEPCVSGLTKSQSPKYGITQESDLLNTGINQDLEL